MPNIKIGNTFDGNVSTEGNVQFKGKIKITSPGNSIMTIGDSAKGVVDGKMDFGSDVEFAGNSTPHTVEPRVEPLYDVPTHSLNIDPSNASETDNPSKQTNKKTSHMIIFNQKSFNTSNHRYGSDEDVKALEVTFSKFGVKPTVHTDLKLNQIEKEIDNLSKTDFTAYKMFMCVLMTHGRENGIVAASDKSFHLRNTIINPILKNKTLNGTSKIFIIVACRGDNRYYESDLVYEDGCILSTKNDVDYSNCLVCYSTYDGHVSKRRITGTYYIQKFCELIDKEGSNSEIHSILLEVNKYLNSEMIQVPIFETTMEKLFLKNLID